jgi:hypothetical protein
MPWPEDPSIIAPLPPAWAIRGVTDQSWDRYQEPSVEHRKQYVERRGSALCTLVLP